MAAQAVELSVLDGELDALGNNRES